VCLSERCILMAQIYQISHAETEGRAFVDGRGPLLLTDPGPPPPGHHDGEREDRG
jgi:hypothetical protein